MSIRCKRCGSLTTEYRHIRGGIAEYRSCVICGNLDLVRFRLFGTEREEKKHASKKEQA